MTGIPHIPMWTPFNTYSPVPDIERGERVLDRIYFWQGVGLRWVADRLADQLDEISSALEAHAKRREEKRGFPTSQLLSYDDPPRTEFHDNMVVDAGTGEPFRPGRYVRIIDLD